MLLNGYVFNSAGPITSWTFDSRGSQGTTLQVYRGSGSTWKLVGQNVISTNTNPRFTYDVPKGEQIQAQVGDVIGIRAHSRAVIPYTGGGIATRYPPAPNHGNVAIGASMNFPNPSNRVYQVKAHQCVGNIHKIIIILLDLS